MFNQIIDKIREAQVQTKKLPKHIGITLSTNQPEPCLENTYHILTTTIRLKIPLITIHLQQTKTTEQAEFIKKYIETLSAWQEIHQHQVKISIIGKWYNLPERIIEPIKQLINSTKDYDCYFLNLCINYNGQEEITDACKLITTQALKGKIQPESIDKNTIKENIYTSYFLSPDIIITNNNSSNGFLLWDSAETKIKNTEKNLDNFNQTEFLNTIKWWQENK